MLDLVGLSVVRTGMDTELTDEEWPLVTRFLPSGWEAAASTTGALKRRRKVAHAGDFLRLLLLWAGTGQSYRQTASCRAVHGCARMSKEAVGKRVRHSGPWLGWLLAELLAARVARPEAGGRRWLATDGSNVVCARGKVQVKLHYALDLGSLRCASLRVTDLHEAEGLHQVALGPGDVVLCDRYYAKPRSLAAAHRAGAQVIVRLGRSSLSLSAPEGGKLDLLPWLRGVGYEPGECAAGFRDPESGEWVGGRVCALRLSEPQAAKARETARRAAKEDHRQIQPETLEWAGFCVVFTTTTDLSAAEVLAWYRARWQVELAFKRLKSLLEASEMPDVGQETAEIWLQAKMVYALLLEVYLDDAGAFSPWGYPLGDAEPPLCLAGHGLG